MNSFLNKLSFISISIWVGGLWSMLMVTYSIFNIIPSSYIAGEIVSNLFFYINLFGIFTLVLTIGIWISSGSYKILQKNAGMVSNNFITDHLY